MKYVRALIGVFLLICLDQYTKYVVVNRLELYTYHPILGDVFGLFYLENKGMAWGLFQNRQVIFLILTIVILVVLGYCYAKLLQEPKFRPLNVCIQFLIAGAIGNMIDRIFHGDVLFQGAVVDFLYIKLIDFPVFNLADMYVTFSIAIIVILLIFRYKEQDFQMFFNVSKKEGSIETEHEYERNDKPESKPIEEEKEAGIHPPVDIDTLFLNEEEEDE